MKKNIFFHFWNFFTFWMWDGPGPAHIFTKNGPAQKMWAGPGPALVCWRLKSGQSEKNWKSEKWSNQLLTDTICLVKTLKNVVWLLRSYSDHAQHVFSSTNFKFFKSSFQMWAGPHLKWRLKKLEICARENMLSMIWIASWKPNNILQSCNKADCTIYMLIWPFFDFLIFHSRCGPALGRPTSEMMT